MKLGLCTSDLDRIDQLDKLGYDYADIGARTLLPTASDGEFAPVRTRLLAAPVPVEALTGFLPGDMRIVGPIVDWPRVIGYLEVTLGRAAEVGVRVVNWGSWQSRLVPEGFSFARAFEQLEQFGQIVGAIAGRYGITIAIEPICPGECNIVYYVRDALHLARVIGRPEVRVLADYYHMVKQSEPMEHLVEAGDWLRHAHTSDDGRRFPTGDGFDQALFFRSLWRAGYDERVSLECRAAEGYEEKARAASKYLRATWAEAVAGAQS
jgi:sugar phosphate isomerase/epimerase